MSDEIQDAAKLLEHRLTLEPKPAQQRDAASETAGEEREWKGPELLGEHQSQHDQCADRRQQSELRDEYASYDRLRRGDVRIGHGWSPAR